MSSAYATAMIGESKNFDPKAFLKRVGFGRFKFVPQFTGERSSERYISVVHDGEVIGRLEVWPGPPPYYKILGIYGPDQWHRWPTAADDPEAPVYHDVFNEKQDAANIMLKELQRIRKVNEPRAPNRRRTP